MKRMMAFVIFCCVVGVVTVFSFNHFSGGLLVDGVSEAINQTDDTQTAPSTEKKLYGKQIIDGETYYFDNNGEKIIGLRNIDRYFYFFDEDGVMLKNTNKTVSFGGNPMPCYINDEGKLGFVASIRLEAGNAGQGQAMPPVLERNTIFNINNLERGVRDIMARYNGRISVYFNDLKTNQKFCLNNTTMYPCCMIKTATLSAFMQQVENNGIDYNQYRQYIGPMIIYSDNTCYNRLMKGLGDGDALLGAKRLNDHCDTIGMSESAVYHGLLPGADYFTSGNRSNVSSAKDIGLYFEKLYYGQLASPAHTQEMLGLYAQCIDREGLAQGLPLGTVYAHKTGEAYACYHDGGIVYAKDRPYILVAFTDDVSNNRAFLKELSAYLYHYQMTTM